MRMMPEYQRRLVRELRQRQTESEAHLWRFLRDGHFCGWKFRRQRPLGRYIADFCCDSAKLVIEIDGSFHDEADRREYDLIREEALNAAGYQLVHFTPDEVLTNPHTVLKQIRQAVLNNLSINASDEANSQTKATRYPLPLRERDGANEGERRGEGQPPEGDPR